MIAVLCVLWLLPLVPVIVLLERAQPGYEDSDGFHRGERP